MRRQLAIALLLAATGCTSALIPRVDHPNRSTTDSDGDGIMDAEDACRDDREDVDGDADADGCEE